MSVRAPSISDTTSIPAVLSQSGKEDSTFLNFYSIYEIFYSSLPCPPLLGRKTLLRPDCCIIHAESNQSNGKIAEYLSEFDALFQSLSSQLSAERLSALKNQLIAAATQGFSFEDLELPALREEDQAACDAFRQAYPEWQVGIASLLSQANFKFSFERLMPSFEEIEDIKGIDLVPPPVVSLTIDSSIDEESVEEDVEEEEDLITIDASIEEVEEEEGEQPAELVGEGGSTQKSDEPVSTGDDFLGMGFSITPPITKRAVSANVSSVPHVNKRTTLTEEQVFNQLRDVCEKLWQMPMTSVNHAKTPDSFYKIAVCRDDPAEFAAFLREIMTYPALFSVKECFDNRALRKEIYFESCAKKIFIAIRKKIEVLCDLSFLNAPVLELYAQTLVKKEINQIKNLLGEQRKHVLTRFCHLTRNYSTIAQQLIAIESLASSARLSSKEQAAARTIYQTCLEIFKKCMTQSHEETSDEGASSGPGNVKVASSPATKKKAKKVSESDPTVDTHHSHQVMATGDYFREWDETVYGKGQKDLIYRINSAMQLHRTRYEEELLQHAHTFPYPAMYNWNILFVGKQIKKRMDYSLCSQAISRDFFVYALNNIEENGIVLAITDVIIKFLQEKDIDAGILKSMELIKEYNMRIMSETELVPDFINGFVDHLSEFCCSGSWSYKHSLAKAFYELLEQKKASLEDVKTALGDYAKATLYNTNRQLKKLSHEQPSHPMHIYQKISILQVRSALSMVFESADLRTKESDPWRQRSVIGMTKK